jgi:hypothetical protein
MPEYSQEEIQNIQNMQRRMFLIAKESPEVQGRQTVWDYRLPGQDYNPGISQMYQEWKEHHQKAPAFDIDYIPNPWMYQYDMEFFIFLNYEKLRKICYDKVWSKHEFYTNNGPTGLPRSEHLLNAISIRWPTVIKHTGEHSGLLVRNPWMEDQVEGIAKYTDNVYYGGGGQGKTYLALAFQCMLFDHFIHTNVGAQCTYSTVNEDKLKGSTWSYVNRLYPVATNRRKFSLYAGLAKKAGDFTFERVDFNRKRIDSGGKFVGILLSKGIKDSRVVDKLTGQHGLNARSYLLDEAQSTDDAPLDAYKNMFLHCEYGWFFMSGNYATDHDLLGVNVEPNIGWENIDENTHIYEGTLKSTAESLDRIINVIHFNNELSPAMVDIYEGGMGAKKWPFLPNLQKRKKLYPNWTAAQKTIACKRFWIGFRYEKDEYSKSEPILTKELLLESECSKRAQFIEEPVNLGSFDFASTSQDRNILNPASIGLSMEDGLPIIEFLPLIQYDKPKTHIEAYDDTADQTKEKMEQLKIAKNGIILDWSSKGPLISMLSKRGITAHFILYHGKLPRKEKERNPYTGEDEDPIVLESIRSFIGGMEKEETVFAHQKIKNQQTLGCYLMRQAFEKKRVRNFGPHLLNNIQPNHGWDKEMMRRKFVEDKATKLLNIDDKDVFIGKYHFSTDAFDTYFQMFYMLYVKLGIKWDIPSLGILTRNTKKPKLDKLANLQKLMVGRF